MSYEDRHDQMLMEILQEKNTVINFLDSIFGFLARRTDFYIEMKNPNDNIGFPPGVKEKLVFSALRKFDPKFKVPPTSLPSSPPPPPVVNEIEVETSQDEITDSNEKIINNTKELDDVEMNTTNKKVTDMNISSSSDVVKSSESFFQPNEYYNGSKFDTYCWSQTITDLEIHVRLPAHIKSAKNLNVQILSDSLKIQEKGTDNIILEGKMINKCKKNDVVWSISNGKLQITLDKLKEILWDRLLDTEPKLDLSKTNCSRYIDELPEEQQAALERLQFDQRQKLLGLPTSDEIKNTELLRKAWDAEGSPFKGQPFDPSIVKFD